MPRPLDLDTLFPAAPKHELRKRAVNNPTAIGALEAGKQRREEISTRWAAIYALELRGYNKSDIAGQLGVSVNTIIHVTNDPRYIEYREKHLAAMDNDFVAMKPLAFAALSNGLRSNDENTALRASEQWFKGAGFGGFAKDPTPTRGPVTAEDVARQLIAVQVNVNVEGGSK